MQLELTLNDDLAKKVMQAAEAAGLTPVEYAERLLKAAAFQTEFERLQLLLQKNFESAGITSDEDVFGSVS